MIAKEVEPSGKGAENLRGWVSVFKEYSNLNGSKCMIQPSPR
jgi:hypothetical protein